MLRITRFRPESLALYNSLTNTSAAAGCARAHALIRLRLLREQIFRGSRGKLRAHLLTNLLEQSSVSHQNEL